MRPYAPTSGSHLPAPLQTYLFWRDPHRYLQRSRTRYGQVFAITPVGEDPLVFLADPNEIAAVLNAPADVLHPGAGGAVIAPLVGERSFMIADEASHLAGRRAILPALKRQVASRHAAMIDSVCRRHLARWPRREPLASHPLLRALCLDMILQTIWGSTVRTDALHRAVLDMFDITGTLALQEPQLRRLPPWHGEWRRFLSARGRVRELIYALISQSGLDQEGLPAAILGRHSPDGTTTSTAQAHDDLMSLILAGHETTASQLAWALQLLAHNPGVQETLIDTLDEGDESYLAATVQEVLRHRPVFLFTIPRVVRKPFEVGGRVFRPPVHLLGCIHLLHHDRDIYRDPESFRPERFIDEPPPAGAWLPWGGGRKRCPGRHLASLEMEVVLRTLLSSATVHPAAQRMEKARWRSVIVTPGGGGRVILRERSRRRRGQ